VGRKQSTAPAVIHIAAREASLRKKIRRHLQELGFHKSADGELIIDGDGKDVVRALHRSQRRERLAANAELLAGKAPELLRHFASGSEIHPQRIRPTLERIAPGTWQADLFRLASLTWSVPVSNGYGRRLRYLVWDAYNEKLMGLIAVGDPVFNLKVRDNFIGWNVRERTARLVNIMDAYVLGAMPPYNELLAGKLVASLVRTRDIYDDFTATYGQTKGIISGQQKGARLLAVTTSSSMGRSSVYNRLKLAGTAYFTRLGYTEGWGHFHIPDSLFAELRDYLRAIGHRYADLHRFGQGPNWRMRTTRTALQALGFDDRLLRHGIKREVFISTLADNAEKILRTGAGEPKLTSLMSAAEVASQALERWVVPRSERRTDYLSWDRENVWPLLRNSVQICADPEASAG
jgi:hypothetical protein